MRLAKLSTRESSGLHVQICVLHLDVGIASALRLLKRMTVEE
jgi:hypothetical protein